MRYVSKDGTWRVQVIALDGVQRLRVLHKTAEGLPLHGDGVHRVGPVQMAGGWWWADDLRDPAEVEKYVPLSELIPEAST